MKEEDQAIDELKKYSQFILDVGSFSFSQAAFNERFYDYQELVRGSSLDIQELSLMILQKKGPLKGLLVDAVEPGNPNFEIGEGVAGTAASKKKPIYVSDVSKDNHYIDLSRKKKGLVSFPMITRNNDIRGVVNLSTAINREYSEFEKQVIGLIVERLNSGIKNKLIYDELAEERNEHRILSIIMQTLAGDEPFNKKITKVMQTTKTYLRLKEAQLLITTTDEKQTKMQIVALDRQKKDRNNFHGTEALKRIMEKFTEGHPFVCGTREEFEKLNICPECGKIFIDIIIQGRFFCLYPISDKGKPVGAILLEGDAPFSPGFPGHSQSDKTDFLTILNQAIKLQLRIKKTSEKILEEKDKWFQIYKNTTDGLILINKDRKILAANNAVLDIFGMKESRILNKSLENIMSILDTKSLFSLYLKPDNLMEQDASQISNQSFINDIEKLFAGQAPKSVQYLVEVNGKRIWLDLSFKLLKQEGDSNANAFIHIRDVTNQKLFDQEKNEFISIVSHELRTPLAGMKGFLSMIINGDYGKTTTMQTKFLKRVAEGNQRMVDLVEDLLDASRIDMGRITLRKGPVEITEIIKSNLENLKSKTNEKKIKIDFKTKEREYYALADKDRLTQIFQNVIDNAIKYSFPNSPVKIEITEKRGFIETSVTDSGVGIPKSEEKYLFQKFYRIHNPLSIVAGGTGLGLYITKKLVDAHDGDIWVKSRDGTGTTFIIKLPAAKQLSLI